MNALPDAPQAYSACKGEVLADKEIVLELWRGNLGRAERHGAKYDWFYLQCPFGWPLLQLLRHGASGPVVGVAAAGPRRMLLAGRIVTTGVLVDLAVAPPHRSLFPALQLQKSLMAEGLAVFPLLYGFPNPKAAAVFARVGYERIGDIVRYVRVLRSAEYLARRMPGPLARVLGAVADLLRGLESVGGSSPRPRCQWREQPWDAIDAIWAAGPEPQGPMTVRDSAFVRWRLGNAPGVRMRYFVATDRRTGKPAAWLACELQEKVMFVRDFWGIDGVGEQIAATLNGLARSARRLGCSSLCLEFYGGANAVAALTRAGFVPRNSRPVYMRFADNPASDTASAEWHLTSSDEDE